jgi:tripartite-type tricarboxylate transporter receptor subunit TctC
MRNFHRLMQTLVMALAASTAAAQGKFPDGPLKVIVPFAAGGGVDNAARLVAKQMQTLLNVPVVVENRPGANGSIGGKAVQTATPDGQTLLFSASTHVLARQVMASPPYDPLTDFSPVARVGEAPLMMVIAPGQPEGTLKDVMAAVKAQPERWTAGLPALGAASHLGTLMFARHANAPVATAVYKGTAPALTDVAGGHVQILIDSIVSLQNMAKTGRVKPIMVTSARRSQAMPQVPTAVEGGFPNFVTTSWYGVWAPKGTPDDRIQALNKVANEAVTQLVRAGAFEQLGIEPVKETVEEFRKFSGAYVTESADLLRGAGFKPE